MILRVENAVRIVSTGSCPVVDAHWLASCFLCITVLKLYMQTRIFKMPDNASLGTLCLLCLSSLRTVL